jgi:hypothetical protein
MKIKLTLTLLASLIIGFNSLLAQETAFRVLASKGINTSNGSALRVGSKITNEQSIQVGTSAYLGLAHVSGRTLEIKQAGTYKISDLTARIKSGKPSSLASKYMDFVNSELSQKQDKNAMARRYKHMSKTGAVTRGLHTPIAVMLNNKEEILGDKAAIAWFINEEKLPQGVSLDQITTYQVSVMDFFGNVVYQTETKDNSLVIDLKKEKLEGKLFTYKITAKGNNKVNTEEHSFVKMKNKKAKEFLADYNELSQDNSALGKIIQAKYLEDYGLLVDALATYKNVIAMEPEVDAYKQLYTEFLERAAFTKETYIEKQKKNTKK